MEDLLCEKRAIFSYPQYRVPEIGMIFRKTTLKTLVSLREKLLASDNDTVAQFTIHKQPIWNFINGPLADALTHVGQINSFRRMAGNPVPKVNVFKGLGRE